jgi:dTDP-glucose pyrophosphorylase
MSSTSDWYDAIIGIGSNVKHAIINLDVTGLKIVLVADDAGSLLGTVTDGDIRRCLLRGGTLETPISDVMNKDFVSIEIGKTLADAKMKMIMHKIAQIPVIDVKMKIHGLRTWDEDEDVEKISNPIVIMAGGKGSRLSPETDHCPKPMLLLAGKPILEHIILKAKNEGFNNFILAIFHLGEMIEDYFGNGSKFGVSISYLKESTPLGTAGALSLLSPSPSLPIIVTNGDVLSEVKFRGILDYHISTGASATMGVHVHKLNIPFGVVETEGGIIIGYSEKPTYQYFINAGVYVLEPHFKELMSSQKEYDMPMLFSKMRENMKQVAAYPIYESWIDVGIPSELLKARKLFS